MSATRKMVSLRLLTCRTYSYVAKAFDAQFKSWDSLTAKQTSDLMRAVGKVYDWFYQNDLTCEMVPDMLNRYLVKSLSKDDATIEQILKLCGSPQNVFDYCFKDYRKCEIAMSVLRRQSKKRWRDYETDRG